jgi:hypothetical protein
LNRAQLAHIRALKSAAKLVYVTFIKTDDDISVLNVNRVIIAVITDDLIQIEQAKRTER